MLEHRDTDCAQYQLCATHTMLVKFHADSQPHTDTHFYSCAPGAPQVILCTVYTIMLLLLQTPSSVQSVNAVHTFTVCVGVTD